MWMQILSILAVLGSGIVAGALLSVAFAIVPAFIAMPVDRYVQAHQLLGRNYDPTMPIIVSISVAFDLVLAALAPGPWTQVLFGTAAALMLAVAVVSQKWLVPINRRVRRLDPDALPPGWEDPRGRWRSWHLVRTIFALLALIVNTIAVLSL